MPFLSFENLQKSSFSSNSKNTPMLSEAAFFMFLSFFRPSNIVENIEQFDAAREFLKKLDISDYVWIGLMRPTNADQFSWT